MEITWYLLAGLFLGAGGVAIAAKVVARSALNRSRAEAEQIKNNALIEAQNKAKEIELAARQEQLKRKEQYERETEQKRNELKAQEGRLTKRKTPWTESWTRFRSSKRTWTIWNPVFRSGRNPWRARKSI